MPSYSAVWAVHKTLVAATVDTVTVTANEQVVEVTNRGSTDPLYVNVGLSTTPVPNPAVAGDDTMIVPAGGTRTITVPGATTGVDLVVKLIAASAVMYSVQAGGQ